MTALVGVFGDGAASAGSCLTAMLGKMRNRGSASPEQFAAPGVFIAASRHDWEVNEPGWVGPVVTVREDWVVAADASLYYVADLCRDLSRHHVLEKNAPFGDLVVAALRTWGDHFAQHVEGDFAIIAWHRPSGRVLLARDFCGKRSIALTTRSARTLVVATSPLAVVEFPGVSQALDLDFIASSISGVTGHAHRTAFAEVGVVPGGATFAWQSGHLHLVDQWLPPPFSSDWEEETSDRAAEELRGLLMAAVSERLPPEGTATVLMSGGWDSTSVFASGRAALERSRRPVRLRPVSIEYPQGDTGNESAYVESIARRWNSGIRWVPIDQMPLFQDADRRASLRDDPRIQPFESQFRALCRVSREMGARIAADGVGGDHLFMVSGAAIMADHLRSFRPGLLWGSWKAWGRRLPHTFARTCLLPQLSRGSLDWIGTVRGRPLKGFWDLELPPWVRPTPGLLRQTLPEPEREPGEGISSWETRRALTTPLVARSLAWNHAIAMDEGILLRSPLLDPRVIRFAATRPLNERHGGPDSKVILRRAMRGLLPDDVLQPRGRKTGTPSDYFKREMLTSAAGEFRHLFGSGRCRLEALGLVDLRALREAMVQYQSTENHGLAALLQMTMEVERWLARHDLAG